MLWVPSENFFLTLIMKISTEINTSLLVGMVVVLGAGTVVNTREAIEEN